MSQGDNLLTKDMEKTEVSNALFASVSIVNTDFH